MMASERVGREQYRYLGSFIACGVGMVVVVAWVLLGKPEEGWWSPPVALVGVPCAIGFVALGVLVIAAYARALRYAVRRRVWERRVVSNGVPAVVVDTGDVRSSGLVMSPGDVEQLSRLEALIRKPLGQR
jgi:hypothetical protein